MIILLHYDLVSAFLKLSYPSHSNKLVYMLYLFKQELCRDVRVMSPLVNRCAAMLGLFPIIKVFWMRNGCNTKVFSWLLS